MAKKKNDETAAGSASVPATTEPLRAAPKNEWELPSVAHAPAGCVYPAGYVYAPGYVRPIGGYLGPAGYVRPVGGYVRPVGYEGECASEMVPQGRGLGFHPDLPDNRDCGWKALFKFLSEAEEARDRADKEKKRTAVQRFGSPIKLGLASAEDAPGGATLREHVHLGDEYRLPPVEDQGQTNSCTAQAAAAMVEFLYGRATGVHEDFSRMFIYFNTRRLLGWTGDPGAYIRTTFKAMRVFGVPPEMDWPFDQRLLDRAPEPFHYGYAGNFKTMKYARLDERGQTPGEVLDRVKTILSVGFPVEFGFTVYESIRQMRGYVIPVPREKEKVLGGHAVLAVGYDDNLEYLDQKGDKQRGGIIIQNSWGTGWGDRGYGFLPYWYIEQESAIDFWTAYDTEWLKLQDFEL
jgi:C1A family cysteine protease